MSIWFSQLSSREKFIIVGAGGIALLLVLFLMVIEPMQKKHQQALDSLESEQILFEYMSKSAKQVNKLSNSGNRGFTTNASPFILVDQGIKRLGLHPANRMTPEGQKKIKFNYDNVSFDKVVQLIQNLEQKGLRLTLFIANKTGVGMVSCRIQMEKT